MSPVPPLPAAEPTTLDLTTPTIMAFVAAAVIGIVVTNLICLAKLGVF